MLLAGDYAYKFKKSVNFGFLDFSTLALRKYFCEEEVRLNGRFSEGLYLGVAAVTGSAGLCSLRASMLMPVDLARAFAGM